MWGRARREMTGAIAHAALCALASVALSQPALAAASSARAEPSGAKTSSSQAAAPAYSEHGADTCLLCHGSDAYVMAIFRTAHARPNDPRGPFGHGGLQCEACHGPGGAHVKVYGARPEGLIQFGARSPTPVARQNAMCLACHRTDAAAHAWSASAHAANGVACADCHQLHAERDPVLEVATQVEVCGKCHQSERLAMWMPERHPLREGKMACTDCHAPHGSTAPASLVKATVVETCTSCHAEFRGPFLWEHQPVTEDCDLCHEPHGSAQPALLRTPAPFLCQQCHQAQGHPSMPFTPQGLPGGAPSAFLLGGSCLNCHSQVHGSNHPSGRALMR